MISIINVVLCAVGGVKVAKTGLGSSAALTSSLVGALLQYFGVIQLNSADSDTLRRGRDLVHNISQVSHSLAQGKIGSGFDVAAAVYGTQVYQRFDESILNSCLQYYSTNNNTTNSSTLNAKLFISSFYELVTSPCVNAASSSPAWNQNITSTSLPLGVDIMMGDVQGGSNTPSMVS